MNRFKIVFLATAVALTAVAIRPAQSDVCIAYGICRTCTSTTSQPCFVTRCGTKPANYNCGACTTNCVPPDV